jgi:hypothetical protein
VIDFRYHLVSIIAIFLALAVGLLVGATTLTGPTESVLNREEHAVTQANATLHTQNKALTQQVGADQAFAAAGASRLLSGLLTGHKVVLVVPPNTDPSLVSGVTTALQQAGATVTGQVQLQPSFFDFSATTEGNLTSLARGLAAQANVKLPPSSSSGVSGQQAATAVLAASILTASKNGRGLAAASSRAILSQFGGYLQVSPTTGSALGTATLAVLLTPAAPPSGATQAANTSLALQAVAMELRSASLGTVVAGSVGAIPNSAINVLSNSTTISTVDNADTSSGQIMVAQALDQLLEGKTAANYGIGPGTAPSPAPTPSATPTSTPGTKGRT